MNHIIQVRMIQLENSLVSHPKAAEHLGSWCSFPGVLVFLCSGELSVCCQSCPTLFDPMDCSPLGFSVLGISQARILERVAISFSRDSSQPRD